MEETRSVRLPVELCDAAERRYGPKFASLEELLIFVLTELVRDDAVRMDRVELEVIEKRLRDLGYM